MTDETNEAAPAADAASAASAAPAATPPLVPAPPEGAEVHVVEQPIGTEFPISAHESIAKKLGVEIEAVFYHLEQDIEAGVHRLKGWLKPSA